MAEIKSIEVTPEMCAAGGDVIQEFSGVLEPTFLAAEVYRTMVRIALEQQAHPQFGKLSDQASLFTSVCESAGSPSPQP